MSAETLNEMIRHIRNCFHHLKLVADDLHDDLGITAAMRGVMESLEIDGEQTVPQIAKSKGVSRQHIQLLVDALAEAEIVEVFSNPQHKRSYLVRLTEQGARSFNNIRRKEAGVLRSLTAEFDEEALGSATQTLAEFEAILRQRITP